MRTEKNFNTSNSFFAIASIENCLIEVCNVLDLLFYVAIVSHYFLFFVKKLMNKK